MENARMFANKDLKSDITLPLILTSFPIVNVSFRKQRSHRKFFPWNWHIPILPKSLVLFRMIFEPQQSFTTCCAEELVANGMDEADKWRLYSSNVLVDSQTTKTSRGVSILLLGTRLELKSHPSQTIEPKNRSELRAVPFTVAHTAVFRVLFITLRTKKSSKHDSRSHYRVLSSYCASNP